MSAQSHPTRRISVILQMLQPMLLALTLPLGMVASTFLPGCATGGMTSHGLIGSRIQPFVLDDLSGRRFSLDDTHGQVVILDFWATWCPSCFEGMEALEALHKKYQDQGLVVIAINVDGPGTQGEVRNAIRQRGYTFTVLLDRDSTIVGRYNPKMVLPFTMILDRNGRISYVHEGFESGMAQVLEKEVQKVLRGNL